MTFGDTDWWVRALVATLRTSHQKKGERNRRNRTAAGRCGHSQFGSQKAWPDGLLMSVDVVADEWGTARTCREVNSSALTCEELHYTSITSLTHSFSSPPPGNAEQWKISSRQIGREAWFNHGPVQKYITQSSLAFSEKFAVLMQVAIWWHFSQHFSLRFGLDIKAAIASTNAVFPRSGRSFDSASTRSQAWFIRSPIVKFVPLTSDETKQDQTTTLTEFRIQLHPSAIAAADRNHFPFRRAPRGSRQKASNTSPSQSAHSGQEGCLKDKMGWKHFHSWIIQKQALTSSGCWLGETFISMCWTGCAYLLGCCEASGGAWPNFICSLIRTKNTFGIRAHGPNEVCTPLVRVSALAPLWFDDFLHQFRPCADQLD